MNCFQAFRGGLKQIYSNQNVAGEITFALVLRYYGLLKRHRIMQTPIIDLFAVLREIQNDTYHETVMQHSNLLKETGLLGSAIGPPKGWTKCQIFFVFSKSSTYPQSPTTAPQKPLERLVRLKINHLYP